MSMKKKLLIAGACVLAALCGAGIWFAPQIRSVMSIAQGAVMDEETRAEMEEENRRLEEELRNRYDVPQGEVNEDINAGVLDGTLSLEEAARQWLEQNGQTALPSAEGDTDAADDGSGAEAVPPDGGTAAVENSGGNGTDAGDMTQEQKDREAAEQKAAEQKAAEQKAAEQKAAEQKAAEQKAAEQKAAEQKAAEQKAAEQKAAEQQAAEQKAAEEAAAKEAAEKAEKEARIQNLIAQAQVLRSVFTSRLDGVIAECKGEFMALPAEQQTTSNKVRIVTARLGEVADMEEECDGQVASIVSQLQELDPDTAAAVQDQYEREKLAKKTSLINEYRNGPAQ